MSVEIVLVAENPIAARTGQNLCIAVHSGNVTFDVGHLPGLVAADSAMPGDGAVYFLGHHIV